jgi:hypothetical protein
MTTAFHPVTSRGMGNGDSSCGWSSHVEAVFLSRLRGVTTRSIPGPTIAQERLPSAHVQSVDTSSQMAKMSGLEPLRPVARDRVACFHEERGRCRLPTACTPRLANTTRTADGSHDYTGRLVRGQRRGSSRESLALLLFAV